MKYLLFAITVLGCSRSPSGVDDAIALRALSAEDISGECAYLASEYPHKRLTCGTKSQVFGFGSAASCEQDLADANASHPTCEVTVGQLEECMAYLYGMTCEDAGADVPESCKRVFSDSCD